MTNFVSDVGKLLSLLGSHLPLYNCINTAHKKNATHPKKLPKTNQNSHARRAIRILSISNSQIHLIAAIGNNQLHHDFLMTTEHS